ncbi:MAG TPA: outer membrane beta-barrel protein [Edaphocola sp.]|nr:outer membrane beta-barrel protein [Edaphocola sp.]
MRYIIAILFLLLNPFGSWSQSLYSLTGIIKDEVNEDAIGVGVKLTKTDGSIQGNTVTEDDGTFLITEVPSGKYVLTVSSVGLKDIVKEVEVKTSDLNLGILKFTSNSTELKGVVVKAARIATQQSGDTTAYNADAFKVNPDATAEDLARKMPGLDISGGQVKAQGETVGKVLVDGKPFFGDDASSTLKNLPAEVVQKMQVYDEKSEQARLTGVDDGQTIKTLNIVTKIEKREGLFGKVYAGAGAPTSSFSGIKNGNEDNSFLYNLGGNINSFKGDRRISIVAQSNNINNQNFSSQDLLGVASAGGRRGFGGHGGPRGGDATSNFMVSDQSGVATTNAFGINYSDKLWEKLELTASYFFNKMNTSNNQITNRDYVSSMTSGQHYEETNNTNSTNFNHRFNARLTYNIDSFNTLIWTPSFSLQANKSVSELLGITNDASGLLNQTRNNFNSDLSGYNYSNMLMYFHRFKKQGRSFNIFQNINGNFNSGLSKFLANNDFFTNPSLNDSLDQQSDIERTGLTIRTNVQYTEPISKASNIQISYSNSHQKTNSSKLTDNFDPLTHDYVLMDSLLSNKYTSYYNTNAVGLGYGYFDKLVRMHLNVDAQYARLEGDRILPVGTAIDRTFKNILPRGMIRFNISKNENLGLFYRSSTSAPSISQLQDVIDNTNPLQLSSGNPNLDQSYTHNLFSRYSLTSPKQNSTFFAMIRGSVTQDYVGNNTIIANDDTTIRPGVVLAKGGQYISQTNLDGYYSLNGFTTYGRPIGFLKSNINLNLSAGITRIPGLINGEKNFSNNKNVGLGIVFSSNISEKIDFTLSSNTNMNFVKNTLNARADINFLNQSTRFAANYIFWKGMVLNTELNHQFFSGLVNNNNQDYLLWNASLGKKIFKKQQGELKLSIFDIMGQNASFTQTYTDAYNQTVQNNVLQRYLMLTFTYNIRAFKSGVSEKDMEKADGPKPWMMHPGGR